MYPMKNADRAVTITAKRIAVKTNIERSLFLRIAISPVARLAREQIPATERDSKARGKGSTIALNNNGSINSAIIDTAASIIADLPDRVVAK
jgi:hypothetical protein